MIGEAPQMVSVSLIRRFWPVIRVVILGLGAMPTRPAQAWHAEGEAVPWQSVYLGDVAGANEHAIIADWALEAIGAGNLGLTRDSDALLRVVDLNASLFRSELAALEKWGDDDSTVLEERLLPGPAHFAGLLRFAWSLNDWINKTHLCPPLPADGPESARCYGAAGWLAILGPHSAVAASRDAYARLHAAALDVAERAEAMRDAVDDHPQDALEYLDFCREAELEALTFEALAQHYLMSRWAIGHMWQRWGVASFGDMGDATFRDGVLVAALGELLHGSPGPSPRPDAMSAPAIVNSEIVPATWASAAGGQAAHAGVGDHRLDSLAEGSYDDHRLDLTAQREGMLRCAQRGWVEVIRAFGRRRTGAYGAWNINLSDGAPPPSDSPLADECWDNWATNSAIHLGWIDGLLNEVDTSPSRLVFQIEEEGFSDLFAGSDLRSQLTVMTWRTWRAAREDPGGTQLARGGLEAPVDVGLAPSQRPPDHLDLARHAELPADVTRAGRDKRALFGFFNRAHADYWCDPGRFMTLVEPMRGSEVPTERAVCRYLASRMYAGTDGRYEGPRAEQRRRAADPATPNDRDRPPSNPICSYFGVDASLSPRDEVPFELHPGYVDVPQRRVAIETDGGRTPFVYESLSHWCDRIPVIDTDSRDVAAAGFRGGDLVVIRGRHFGAEAGTLTIELPDGTFQPAEIVGWSNREIEFELPAGIYEDAAPRDLPVACVGVTVTRGDETERKSLGHDCIELLDIPTQAPVVRALELVPAPPAEWVPGSEHALQVEVYDEETVEDLIGGDASVRIDSVAIADSPLVLSQSSRRTITAARFSGDLRIAMPLNDRSNCGPDTYLLSAMATDRSDYPDEAPVALTGPIFELDVAVANLPPSLPCDFQARYGAPFSARAGEPLEITVAVFDPNNDGTVACPELPVGSVRIVDISGPELLTVPSLRNVVFEAVERQPGGVSVFRARVEIDGRQEATPEGRPVVLTIEAHDDAGMPLAAPPGCVNDPPDPTVRVVIDPRDSP